MYLKIFNCTSLKWTDLAYASEAWRQPECTTMGWTQLSHIRPTHTTKVLSGRYIPLTLASRGLCLVVSRRLSPAAIGALSPGGSASPLSPDWRSTWLLFCATCLCTSAATVRTTTLLVRSCETLLRCEYSHGENGQQVRLSGSKHQDCMLPAILPTVGNVFWCY